MEWKTQVIISLKDEKFGLGEDSICTIYGYEELINYVAECS